MYEKYDKAKKAFCAVRDSLEPHTPEYRLAFSKPLWFYLKHTTEQAIHILKNEVNNQ